MNNSITSLTNLGQSLWYDNIQRRLIENGELDSLIQAGEIRGITSNPTIFHNAIAKSSDYDSFLFSLAWAGLDAEGIFWSLAIQDIRDVADRLLNLYHSSNKVDGYVSLEVNPLLANDTEKTIKQAKVLWTRVCRPNLMIKIPATPAGIPAIREVIAEGINVNVTLIFSLERHAQVMDAYMDGLEKRLASGHPIDHVASVASFFVSRLDSKVDDRLKKMSTSNPGQAIRVVGLAGKASIANARLAYASFQRTFSSERFSSLRTKHAAQIQRPLWASTSTKNPDYSDTLYVDNLIGPDTVNTVPPQTLDAFRDHGVAEVTLTRNLPQAEQFIKDLEEFKIYLKDVTRELEEEGVASFTSAFSNLLETIEARRGAAVKQLGLYRNEVARRISRLAADNTSRRIFEIDPSLWTLEPAGQAEIKVRLGWLHAISNIRPLIPEIITFRDKVLSAGFKKVLLLGMGGSSLAPEVMARVFSDNVQNGLKFSILDSTDPAQVTAAAAKFPPDETLYIVSSKSGGTVEVNALFTYFWEISGKTGMKFIAITDPNTALEKQARSLGFRKVFLGDPTVGGRFSALTPFGIVPAALMGIDIEKFLDHAESMSKRCEFHVPAEMNPGMALGAIMGQMALDGRDKMTFISDPPFAPLGAWLEQLIAESSGKNGKGIVVVDGETLVDPVGFGDDRFFVYLRSTGDHDKTIESLSKYDQPSVTINVENPYDLGAEFYRWEFATAVACSILGVNAFDQPDVQLSKDITWKKINHYALTRDLEEGPSSWDDTNTRVFCPHELKGADLKEILDIFLSIAGKHDFIGINAYLPRIDPVEGQIQSIRNGIAKKTGCATTVGFGPRFLHSTGQLHKGGKNNGVFIQLTVDPSMDLDIPGQNMTFGILERAQALGDYEALVSRGRRIIRIHLPGLQDLDRIMELMS